MDRSHCWSELQSLHTTVFQLVTCVEDLQAHMAMVLSLITRLSAKGQNPGTPSAVVGKLGERFQCANNARTHGSHELSQDVKERAEPAFTVIQYEPKKPESKVLTPIVQQTDASLRSVSQANKESKVLAPIVQQADASLNSVSQANTDFKVENGDCDLESLSGEIASCCGSPAKENVTPVASVPSRPSAPPPRVVARSSTPAMRKLSDQGCRVGRPSNFAEEQSDTSQHALTSRSQVAVAVEVVTASSQRGHLEMQASPRGASLAQWMIEHRMPSH